MITLLYLDVIEICLLNMPDGKTVGKIKPAIIVEQLRLSTRGVRKSTINKTRMILKDIFPIYKNMRQHTKCFKINQSIAYDFLIENGLLLRDVEHARWSYLQQEVK